MKKLFTLMAVAAMATTGYAQNSAEPYNTDGVVILSKVTIDSVASEATSNQTYIFDASCKGITMSMAGRAQSYQKRQNYDDGLNYKKGSAYTINLPQGVKMYGIQMAGYSQGDNWNVIQNYGLDATAWEFTETLADMSSASIVKGAKYPIDPCVVNRASFPNEETHPAYHKSGYTFASISFGDEPYEGTFTFIFGGNNQQRGHIRVFTSKEAWDTLAEKCAKIEYNEEASTGIKNVNASEAANAYLYNIAGQRISKANGIFIKNGKKYFCK